MGTVGETVGDGELVDIGVLLLLTGKMECEEVEIE